MKAAITLLLFTIVCTFTIFGQITNRINKYAVGIEVNAGHSFPGFDREQDQWRASFYPAGGITVLFANRINQHLTADLGLGVTGYALTNKGPIDKYTLDFTSPHFVFGVGYATQNRSHQEGFIKLTTGVQLGFQDEFIDVFENYTVTIKGNQAIYYFLRPEIGMRRYFKRKMKGSRFKVGYELGAFYRYNINDLGTARIVQSNFNVVIQPRGNIIGAYLKFLFPVGRKTIKIQQKIVQPRTIIYNPRYLE